VKYVYSALSGSQRELVIWLHFLPTIVWYAKQQKIFFHFEYTFVVTEHSLGCMYMMMKECLWDGALSQRV
jgi:hypothetical protein